MRVPRHLEFCYGNFSLVIISTKLLGPDTHLCGAGLRGFYWWIHMFFFGSPTCLINCTTSTANTNFPHVIQREKEVSLEKKYSNLLDWQVSAPNPLRFPLARQTPASKDTDSFFYHQCLPCMGNDHILGFSVSYVPSIASLCFAHICD